MAIFECRECKKEVSTDATACPHCGCPDPGKKNRSGCLKAGCLSVLVLCVLVLIIGTCVDRDDSSSSAKRPSSSADTRSEVSAKIRKLDAETQAIPASDIDGNLKAYQELLKLVPSNQRYKDKVAHYQGLKDEAAKPETKGSSPSIEFAIINDEVMGSNKRSVDVRLQERVSKTELTSLARKIYRPGFERTFILYYLPDMTVGSGAWATSHYNPSLEVKILGATIEQAKTLNAPAPEVVGRKVIGAWTISGLLPRRVDIYEDESGLHIATKYNDGSGSIERADKKTIKGRLAYVEKSAGYGEYYVVNARGDLELWDDQGLIDSGKPVR